MPERRHSLSLSSVERERKEGGRRRGGGESGGKENGEEVRVGPVCSGQYHLLLFIVASACPFVIYVCFMARRIRKHLIKDGRVVGREEEATCNRAGRVEERPRKGHAALHTSPRNSLVFPPAVATAVTVLRAVSPTPRVHARLFCFRCGRSFVSRHIYVNADVKGS